MSTRELHQWSPGISTAAGPQHTLRAHLRKQERAGEIKVGWQHATLERRSGRLTVPYVRLVPLTTVRRRRAVRVTVFVTSAAMGMAGVLYALWTIRIFIFATLFLALLAALLMRFLPHLARGCTGIHCAGCKG